jgi:hypothetical protein
MKSFVVGTSLAALLCGAAQAQAVQWREQDGGNGHWYRLSTGTATWDAARTQALSVGGHLVTISSAAENQFVHSRVVANGTSFGPFAWLGAVSAQGQCANPAGYLWATGQAFSYYNWAAGFPVGGTACAASYSPNYAGQWVNRARTETAKYVIEWEADCNNDGIVDYGQILSGQLLDNNGDGIPDCCQEGGGCACPAGDCNGNGICDDLELGFPGNDCDNNGVLDKCDIAAGAPDCNGNGVLDSCDLYPNPALDCDADGVLDSCEIAINPALDCNNNGKLDFCDIRDGVETDCNENGIPDSCDITIGGMPDCNGNGKPDSCDLPGNDCNANGIPDECDIASGFDPDPEGDGIPNSCEPPSAIKLIGPAAKCLGAGDEYVVDVLVNNPTLRMDAGQFKVKWDPEVLRFVGADVGEAPITTIPVTILDQVGGTLFWISSVPGGGVGTLADTRVSTLRFEVVGLFDTCEPREVVVFDPSFDQVIVANGTGASDPDMPTINPVAVRIDSVGPTLTNVPPSITVPADAGAGCFAARSIGTPTVVDACGSGTTTLTYERSGGGTLADPWPCGVTVVTWIARDQCDRETRATTTVTVENNHQLSLMVAYEGAGYAESMTRCIDFTFNEVSMSLQLTFVNGVASATIQLPVGIYSCATADDDLHSLVSRNDVVISGTQYTVMFMGNQALVNGDVNDDNVVNVVDWAIVVTRIGTPASVDTNCDTQPFHVDFNGDGLVTDADGQYVLDNILEVGDNSCSVPQSGGTIQLTGGAPSRIRVQDLGAVIGGADAQRADLTGDGVVDMRDVQRWRDRRGVAVNAPQRKR